MTIENAIGNIQLDIANNLSDVPNKPLALSNLGGIGATTTNILTNKSMDGAFNTFTNLPSGSINPTYTPLYYSPTDATLNGYLHGIDNAFGPLNKYDRQIGITPGGGFYQMTAPTAVIDISFGGIGYVVRLPNATTMLEGQQIRIINLGGAGAFFDIYAFGGVTVVYSAFPWQQTITLELYDNSTAAGVWRIVNVYAFNVVPNEFLATPSSGTGPATFRTITSADLVSLNGQLFDNSSALSENWWTRTLYDSTGTTLSINWGTRLLYNSLGRVSLNYNNYILYDAQATPIPSVTWNTRFLTDASFVNSLAWNLRNLIDNANKLSIDWNARQAYASDGTTLKIDWSNPDSTNFTSIQGTEFAIVPGAAPVVNYITVNGAPTGNSPIFTSVGTDTNVDMTFMTKGIGDFDFTSGSGSLLLLQSNTSAVNSFVMENAATGNAPNLYVFGTDTNINLQLSAQGTGVVFSNNPISGFAGFRTSEAANGKQGVATLVAGTVTVSNTSITANSRIFLTAQDNNSVGALRISARVASTSFTITSFLNTDTGVVAYEIFEPA